MFFGSEEAGTRNAVVFTLVQNCRLRGVNPEEYLKDVLERLPRMTNQDDLGQLTPLHWKKAREQSRKPSLKQTAWNGSGPAQTAHPITPLPAEQAVVKSPLTMNHTEIPEEAK